MRVFYLFKYPNKDTFENATIAMQCGQNVQFANGTTLCKKFVTNNWHKQIIIIKLEYKRNKENTKTMKKIIPLDLSILKIGGGYY